MHRVRVRAWLRKLYEATSNRVWKKARNQYAALLVEQLKAGVLVEPFNALPKDGPGLPPFPSHLRQATEFHSQMPECAGVTRSPYALSVD